MSMYRKVKPGEVKNLSARQQLIRGAKPEMQPADRRTAADSAPKPRQGESKKQ